MHTPAHRLDTQIYVRIAALCLGINITGFGLNAALGRVDSSALSPILYVHALLFVAWSVLAVVQPSLVARGNPITHRKLGWAMIVLAVAMGVSGLGITVSAISAGRMAPANIFMMINILTVAGFLGLVAAALAFRRKNGVAQPADDIGEHPADRTGLGAHPAYGSAGTRGPHRDIGLRAGHVCMGHG